MLLFQLYSTYIWCGYNLAQKTTVVSVFEIGVSWNTRCDKLVSFPILGHTYKISIVEEFQLLTFSCTNYKYIITKMLIFNVNNI